MTAFGIHEFDFLKIDIEGGEVQLFGAGKADHLPWVDASKIVALELHPWVQGSVDTVFNYFKQHDNFVYKNVTGEYDVFVRRDSGFKILAQSEEEAPSRAAAAVTGGRRRI